MIALPPSFAGGTNVTDTELFPRVPTRPVGGPGTVAADATSASGIASIDATSRTQPTTLNFFTAPAPTLTGQIGHEGSARECLPNIQETVFSRSWRVWQ